MRTRRRWRRREPPRWRSTRTLDHAEVAHHLGELLKDRDRPLHRLFGESPREVDVLAEAGDPHQAHYWTAAGIDDEEPGGIRAAVDGRHRPTSLRGRRLGDALCAHAVCGRLYPELVAGPPADRVRSAGEIPGEMGVKALDAPARPPTPPAGLGPV